MRALLCATQGSMYSGSRRLTEVLNISCLPPIDAAIATDVRCLKLGRTGDATPGNRLRRQLFARTAIR